MTSKLKQDKFVHHSPCLLCFSIGFFLFRVAVSQIPLGSVLSVEENNSWVSSNGDFAIGFFERTDQLDQYSVGIRFNSESIPVGKQTVVWVAGADFTVGNMSHFQLTQSGELVLVDSFKGMIVWSSKTSQRGVVSALLRDNGNLVLVNGKTDVVWQSFDYPSDALLPDQNFRVHMTLRAASKNSVSSYYSLYMNSTGQLELRWESNVVYWTSDNPSASNLSAVLTSGGALKLLEQNSEPVWSVYGDDHNDNAEFRFLRLDVDGNLRLYSWIEASQSWASVWQAVEDQCRLFATCEQHGICVYNALGSPECQCPFKTTSDLSMQCLAQTCQSGSSMITYEHTFLYGIYPPNDTVVRTSLHLCKNLCAVNPTCTASTFVNDGSAQCQIKTTLYFSGYSAPSLNSISFIKKCSDPLAADPNLARFSPALSPARQSYRLCIPCVIGAASGSLVVFAIVQLVVGYIMYKRRNLIWKKAESAFRGYNSKGLMMLSISEIEEVTGNFKNQIGPKMYRGLLPNKQPVAIKDLDMAIDERKFRAAVAKIGSMHHRNLVKLEGFCCESGRKYLVYEYVKNGSLNKFIEDDELSKKLTWRSRVEILLSVARSICYLHKGCREFVCHGNLKCENVVLDKHLQVKVSEFGLATLNVEASYGGEKDVKDFGNIVLTLVSGCQEVAAICEAAYEDWFLGHPERVLDRRLEDEADMEQLERALRTAFWCLQPDERMRPSMDEVVKVLEGVLRVDPPPPPFGCESLSAVEDTLDSGLKPLDHCDTSEV